MTTLAFGTIGIDPQRESDVPKQIYDISNLVNSTSGQISMYEIIGAFEKIASEEISYYTREAPSFEQVLDDLVTFPESLLVKDKGRLKLNSSYQGRFSKFITELLGNTKYREYTHVSDILFLKIMSVLIQKYFKKEMDIENINGKINEIITERSRISKLEGSEETRELHKIVGKYGKKSEQGKIIKNMLPVQAYLYDQILELG